MSEKVRTLVKKDEGGTDTAARADIVFISTSKSRADIRHNVLGSDTKALLNFVYFNYIVFYKPHILYNKYR